jgi:hypothetical protein
MVDLALLQSVSYIAGALGVCVAAIYYIMTLRVQQTNMKNTLDTRQAQLFMPIYSTYYSDDFIRARTEIMKWKWDSYDDYMSKYSYESNPDAYVMWRKVFGYLEGLGVLVRRELIDPSLIDDLMSGAVVSYWEKFGPFTVEQRRRMDFPQVGEQIEYLYGKIKPIVERQREELRGSQ